MQNAVTEKTNFSVESSVRIDSDQTLDADDVLTMLEVHDEVVLDDNDYDIDLIDSEAAADAHDVDDEEVEIEILPDPNPEYHCFYCGQEFGSQWDFLHHSNKKHAKNISRVWTSCRGCLWLFPTRKSLRSHGCKAALRHIHCAFCSMAFAADSDFVIHANVAHIKLLQGCGWRACSSCGMFFPNYQLRWRHIYSRSSNCCKWQSSESVDGTRAEEILLEHEPDCSEK